MVRPAARSIGGEDAGCIRGSLARQLGGRVSCLPTRGPLPGKGRVCTRRARIEGMQLARRTTVANTRGRMALRRPHEEYASLAIAAAPGTQEAVVEALSSHVPGDGRVLDFGAHTGAMVRRLKDRGFRAVTASDLSNRLADPTVPFVEADLNGPFAERFTDRFDAISACEVIEHLNDPRHFLNECWK